MENKVSLERRYEEALLNILRECYKCNRPVDKSLCEDCVCKLGFGILDNFIPYFEYLEGRENDWKP